MTKKLGLYPLSVIRAEMRAKNIAVDAVAYVAKVILDGIDHDHVKKCYGHCFKGEIVVWV